MNRGALFITTAAALACSACLADHGKLEVRSVDNGLKSGSQPVPYRVAEAYGQLALGNVALALEGFRKAGREDPASVDAFAGMAQCYDKMGRFDLSRHYYEQALAVAPRNGTVLALFASSLELQGLRSEAASVRGEMAGLALAGPPAPQPVEQAVARPAPAMAAPVGKSVTIALAPPAPTPVSAAPPKATAMNIAPVGKSVTIKLAPLPPVQAPSRQPRIERMSLTEVALITSDGPRWVRPQTAQMAARKPARPTEQMAALPGTLRLLNAARVDRLAARTRNYLGRFGWRDIIVGDAAVVRPRSLILYPQNARAEATKLATRFGFAMAPRANVRQLTILLGRDAAGHPELRPGA